MASPQCYDGLSADALPLKLLQSSSESRACSPQVAKMAGAILARLVERAVVANENGIGCQPGKMSERGDPKSVHQVARIRATRRLLVLPAWPKGTPATTTTLSPSRAKASCFTMVSATVT